MKRSLIATLGILGPGFAVAATGVGAGDIVTCAVAGASFGTVILWAAVIGALLKYTLSDGIARWQLATGTTLLVGWSKYLHRSVLLAFAIYLVLWTFVVAGALMAGCGLATHALFPSISVAMGGVIHSIVAFILVFVGRYSLFERMMKVFIGLMFVTIVFTAVLIRPDLSDVVRGLFVIHVPSGSGKFLLGVMGGVGSSVTLLNYSYWIQERGWHGPACSHHVRLDLGAAYLMIGIFGIAIIVVASGIEPGEVRGNEMALELARRIAESTHPAGKWIFLVGFWGAVFTSMLGVWQGVPYLFTDFWYAFTHNPENKQHRVVNTRSPIYRRYLLFIAIPPMLLLLVDRPVWIVLVYSVAGAMFMPFLALTLLYLNNRFSLVAGMKNGWLINLLLCSALILFGYLCYSELAGFF